MLKRGLCCAFVAIVWPGGLIAGDAGLEAAIHETGRAYKKAYDAGDATALSELWTSQGEHVSKDGVVVKGRKAIETAYSAFFEKEPRTTMEMMSSTLRIVADTTVIQEGVVTRTFPSADIELRSRYTAIYSKEDDAWRIAGVRDWGDPDPGANLAWIIGQWTATADTVRMETKFEWILDHSFIRREFKVYDGQDKISEGFEIVTVNRDGGLSKSVSFSSNGSAGEKTWNTAGDQWYIHATGTTADGGKTSAFNTITIIDKNNITWESRERMLNDERLPDIEPITLTRSGT